MMLKQKIRLIAKNDPQSTSLKAVFCALFFLVLRIGAYAQQGNLDYYKSVSVASPNAAALGKYGDIPVSNHTGIPSISIPLYTVKEGPLSLPISLSYHASGLKVEETASWVGAGWSLNAGGVITRSVRGLPDDYRTSVQTKGYFKDYGYYSYPESFQTGQNPFTSLDFYYQGFENGMLDSEPDLFFFNFNGYSGKFYFRDDRTAIILPQQDIKIEYDFRDQRSVNGHYQGLSGFILTTPDGNKYYFGQKPGNNSDDQIELTTMAPNDPQTNPYGDPGITSSWYLYKITSADNQFAINLSYSREKYGYHFVATKDITGSTTYTSGSEFSLAKNYISGARLSSISSTNCKVDFITGAARADLSSPDQNGSSLSDLPNSDAKVLGAVSIKNRFAQEIKKFNFNYDYFYDTSPLPTTNSGFNTVVTSDQKRLKLLSVQETDGTNTFPPYSFDYFSEAVPRRLSFGRDHWGFINGANNTGLISSFNVNGTTVPGANRESAWPAMRGGTLKKITYPTGGYVALDFEPNTFWLSSGVNAMVGGLRIKRITRNDGITGVDQVTDYDYGDQYGAGNSSGILYGKPTIAQILRNDLNARYLQDEGSTLYGCFATPASWVLSPTTIRPMDVTQGYHIGYSQVKVSESGNGYKLYRYFGQPFYNVVHDDVAYRTIANTAACDPDAPNWPAAPFPFDETRGELSYEAFFNNSGQELRRVVYDPASYTTDPVKTPAFITRLPPGTSTFWGITNYELTSERKTYQKVTETNFDNIHNTSSIVTTEYFYESPFHNQLTKKVFTNSKGEVLTTKYSYAKDVRVASADALPDGYIPYTSAIANAQIAYNSRYLQCNNSSDTHCKVYAYHALLYDYANARKNYLTALRNKNYSNASSQYNSFVASAKNNADASLKPVLEMHGLNILAPIEISTWRDNNLIAANFTQFDYGANSGTAVYPSVLKQIYLTTLSNAFTPVAMGSGGTTLSRDSRYEDASSLKFNQGNIAQVTKSHGRPASYVWGYNNTLPIATAANAASSDIFYENFEDGNGIGAGDDARTGHYSYNGNYTKTLTGLTNGSYMLRYWIKNGSAWQMQINAVNVSNGSYTINLNGQIDDVTFYPVGAQITTYTYDPLSGMTSSTDLRGITTFYEYDSFQRLYRVKDLYGHILKQYCYNYAGQATDCTVPNAVLTPPAATGNTGGVANCNGPDQKVIDGVCETGLKVYTGSSYNGYNYTCTYHYQWSDASISPNYTENSSSECAVDQ
ncbi:hypothetical protein MUY27_20205 [Mucilaginibacter sp. RS28]|uniref:YD repeat-containing protein n=1 Tax=Mucilaginibacter straminoryzae TaxID=2932774 RepID=A0A9X1X6Y0_9SPHI|nr:hypothetical protein [Mucilaginibacter straminoryzae]MCJ8212051.1 hypothetical protein [Mucilaginibacter straminoryzae]